MMSGIGKILENGTIVNDDEFSPYHNPQFSRTIPAEQRKFIAWDGEGVNLRGEQKPQSYVLFGSSVPDISPLISEGHLRTFEILSYILRVGERYPNAFHVGFAFGYDSNMIVQSLSQASLTKLHAEGKVTLRRRDGSKYHIQMRLGKWFSVTRFRPNYDRRKNPHAKLTVRIYDIFGFFTKKFVTAYEELVGPAPAEVKEGKDNRGNFKELGPAYIEKYWRIEIEMLRQLAEELRVRLYSAGLRITQWHGPGALASFALKQHRIDEAMAKCPDPVREAAKYGYAGGRFEIYQLGRISGRRIYSIDINSAYPFGISQLPNLNIGTWSHVYGTHTSPIRKIARFGIYRVRLLPQSGDRLNEISPGPLFHRDKMGNISYPWNVEGWYWSPEVRNLFRINPERYQILEGWEYRWTRTQYDISPEGQSSSQLTNIYAPFEWVKETYNKRREWKEKGYASQLALKLMLNSLYGKMAQRVGWNTETWEAPKWHQLEWAGWATSLTRAMLWDVMRQIPFDQLIAVETDGLYTTMDPSELGIYDSKELGKWEVSSYDEIMYVQSGMAWLRKGDEWKCKRRGLDARTFGLDACIDYLRQLAPNKPWLPYDGTTTRFIGLGAALNSAKPLRECHCVWRTSVRQIKPGMNGKRVHIPFQCEACRDGYTAYEKAHTMSIRSRAYESGQYESKPHDIPWEGDEAAEWRKRKLEMEAEIGDISYA